MRRSGEERGGVHGAPLADGLNGELHEGAAALGSKVPEWTIQGRGASSSCQGVQGHGCITA